MSLLPSSVCLGCGDKLDAATKTFGPGSSDPKPGDMTICFRCGHQMVFTRSLRLREPTKAEQRKAALDPRIKFVETKRREVMRKAKH